MGVLIQNGEIVTDGRRFRADVLVEGDTIARIGTGIVAPEGAEVIDAAGKLSRFTKRRSTGDFGIQYVQPGTEGAVLKFFFFDDGYGGSVSVERGRLNSCFLVKKHALHKYIDRKDCLVTGPLAYDKLPGDFIAVGDAAGMVDPFCGEGMRHALETGMLAAQIVVQGIRRGAKSVRYAGGKLGKLYWFTAAAFSVFFPRLCP